MIEALAQLANPPEPTGWVALAIQGGIGTIAVFMLRWMMKVIDTQLKAVTDGQDRMRREIAESNDRNGKAQLMLILAMHQVDGALRNQAQELIAQIKDAQSARDKEK